MSDPFSTRPEPSSSADPDSPTERPVLPRDEQQASQQSTTLPVALFVLTCISTYYAGGLLFSAALMTTLLAHELGHFLQARRYHVPASLPYFLPMPFNLIGTLGAVIAMHPGMGNRRSLFDIAVTGPLAGLVPAFVFSMVGLSLSEFQPIAENQPKVQLGAPLVFQWMAQSTLGPTPEGHAVALHPLAYAGWVGIFITALNLIPIGQLDGGHILYALLRGRAHTVATILLLGAAAAVVLFGYYAWTLMILLLLFIGPIHPPTADDTVPLGVARKVIGWVSLLFVIIGFTPTPFVL